jgi:RND family efflux transporter MFP subunit
MKIPLLVLTVLFGMECGCGSSHPDQTAAAASAAPASVETVAVVAQMLNTTVSLPAQLLPYESVDIYPKVTGFLESIRVDVGSRVHKGEALMTISAPELMAQRSQAEAAVQAAQAQLASAQAKYASDQGTYLHLASAAKTAGVVAANDLMVASQTAESDKAAVSAAEHNVAAAREALHSTAQMESYLTIAAPFDGVVTARNLHPGALTGPAAGQAAAQPIIRIVDAGRMRLMVPVPEADASAIKAGQLVRFSVPEYPGQTFQAPVARIAGDIDQNTRTMHVELDVKNADQRLSAGSFATVAWPVQRRYPTLFVPASAVTSDQQHSFVIRVRDGKTEWVTVQTGQTVDGSIEVFGDLHGGDEVVRTASDSIRNGQQVNAHPAKAS